MGASIITPSYSETDVLRALCKKSYKHFVQEFWECLEPEQNLVWNWHHDILCDELQGLAEGVFAGQAKDHDTIINISPGTTKSTLTSVMFPPWVWSRMPSARFICASHTDDLAMDLSRKSRNLILSEKYLQCFPEIQLTLDQNTKHYFINTRGGFRLAVGVGGSVIGRHGHFLMVDDPIDPRAAGAMSETELKEVNKWCQETLPTRKVDKAKAVTILIMQRLHQNDPTGAWLERRKKEGQEGKLKQYCIPATNDYEIVPAELEKYYVDGLMDPLRLSREVLAEARADLGEYGFAGQYGQAPVPPGGGMFKVARLSLGRPSYLKDCKVLQTVRYWDKAGTPKGGAFTVGVKMCRVYNPVNKLNYFGILDVVRGQWDSAEREKIILDTATGDGKPVIQAVEQEPGSGGKESAEGTVGRLAGFRVRIDKVTGDKVVRADPFSSSVNAGFVWVENAEWARTLIEEMRYFPYSTYKDQVDAASGAYAMLSQKLISVGAL